MHIFTALTVAFLAVNATGCGCTEVGCQDGLTIDLKSASGAWAPGSYVFAVDADGTKSTCTVDLPFVKDPDCTHPALMHVTFTAPDPVAANTVIAQVFNFVTAAHVYLTISRDGAVIAEKDYTPTYTINEPNGPTCGPTCHVAQDTLAVP
jgi:hypothetical protein